jgi:hypothetical protein
MKYKDFNILANAKSYSLWTIDNDGRLDEHKYDFEGFDLISYVIESDKYGIDESNYDFKMLKEL